MEKPMDTITIHVDPSIGKSVQEVFKAVTMVSIAESGWLRFE